jgi:osmoprotectant transport system permease protein
MDARMGMVAGFRQAWQILVLLGVFTLGVWAKSSGILDDALRYQDDILYLARQHMELVAISGGLAVLIGVPLGVFLARASFRILRSVIGQIVNLGTTIPTLAILAMAMTVFGLGLPSAVFGLTILTLLPIVLNTVAGIESVPPALIEAARGMGMTNRQILFKVELPNALFVILAGLRTAFAINVGTVPLAFLIGGGGLGELIFTGIDLMEPGLLLAGAIPTALLAVLVDALIGQAQYWLVPRGVNPLR